MVPIRVEDLLPAFQQMIMLANKSSCEDKTNFIKILFTSVLALPQKFGVCLRPVSGNCVIGKNGYVTQ